MLLVTAALESAHKGLHDGGLTWRCGLLDDVLYSHSCVLAHAAVPAILACDRQHCTTEVNGSNVH